MAEDGEGREPAVEAGGGADGPGPPDLGGVTALLTGGGAFIGAHVARELLGAGARVRCLVEPGDRREGLAGLDAEILEASLTDPDGVAEAADGAELLFHCAEDYRIRAPDPSEMRRRNVEATRVVLDAAARAGVGRAVHMSSVGALGRPRGGVPADEETPVRLEEMVGHYQRTKFLAERLARGRAAEGLPVVIVNKSACVGAMDFDPSPIGGLIVDFLARALPAYVDAGRNLVDVRDVARGHLLAAERGRPGRRYILAGRDLTLEELFRLLSQITGIPGPRRRVPRWVPWLYAAWEEALGRVARRPPRVSLEGVRVAQTKMFVDASRAERELGFRASPLRPALGRAVAWFRDRGYVSEGRGHLAAG